MCILPVLTYFAQSWSLTEHQKSKLKICQRAMERSIIGAKRTHAGLEGERGALCPAVGH